MRELTVWDDKDFQKWLRIVDTCMRQMSGHNHLYYDDYDYVAAYVRHESASKTAQQAIYEGRKRCA